MARFPNGKVPAKELVLDRHGNPWFPGTYRKWVKFQKLVHDRTGVWLYVTPKAYGAFNTYRDEDGQVSIRSALGVRASVPGRSSHGGDWTGQTTGAHGLPTWVQNVESGAFDVANWAEVPWAVFVECAREAGLLTDVVVPRERWHVVDLDPWGAPAPAATTPKQAAPAITGGDDLVKILHNGLNGDVFIVGPKRIKHLGSMTDVRDAERTFGPMLKLNDRQFRIALIGFNVPYDKAKRGTDWQG